jgi:hypothetical protein
VRLKVPYMDRFASNQIARAVNREMRDMRQGSRLRKGRRLATTLVTVGIVSVCLGATLSFASATGSHPFSAARNWVSAVAAQYPGTEAQPDQGAVLGDRREGRENRAGDRTRAKRRRARNRGGVLGGNVPAGAEATRPVVLGDEDGGLPFTGIAAIVLLAAGVLLFGSGTAMRRALQDPRYRLN